MCPLDDLDRLHRDPRVMETLGGLRSRAETARLLDEALAHWEDHCFGLWMVRNPATGGFAGRGGLRHVLVEGQPEMEVAYALMAEFWGRGLATELARPTGKRAEGPDHMGEAVVRIRFLARSVILGLCEFGGIETPARVPHC